MALITLKEYAEKLGKNPTVCRQKAIRGTFKTAVKRGRDWWIDEDEPYTDARIKNGNYIDFRYGYKYQKERIERKKAQEIKSNAETEEAKEENRPMTVINSWGTEVSYELSVQMMDDDIREALHAEIAPCTDQEFFDAYAKAHKQRFGEEWEPDKKNPRI